MRNQNYQRTHLAPLILNLNFIISEQDVIDQLKILNIFKRPGPDGISPISLKETCISIVKPLTKILNLSLRKNSSIYMETSKYYTCVLKLN